MIVDLYGNAGRFKEIWACDFEYQHDDDSGERCRPVCMVAEDLINGRQIRLWRGEFGLRPPFNIGDDALFLAYNANAELGCFWVLGWPKPQHILDFYVVYSALRNGYINVTQDGKRKKANPALLDVLRDFGKDRLSAGEKSDMRKLI